MNHDQSLSVHDDTLDEFPQTNVDVMVSEHVLIRDNKRFSFFHQSFFDYAFARSFVRRKHRLSELIFNSEQVLFRRAQVRQILVYERDADRGRYLADLQLLISDQRVRPHLRQVVVAYLAALENPVADEWKAIAPLVISQNASETWGIWRGWFHSSTWFRLLDSLSEIQQWLASEDRWLLEQALTLLGNVVETEGDRVAELIAPHIGTSPEWNNAFLYLIRRSKLANSRRLFELFLKAIDDGLFDAEDSNSQRSLRTLMIARQLVESKPEWSCQAIAHYLRRRLEISVGKGELNPFGHQNGTIPLHSHDGPTLIEASKQAPAAFLGEILPIFLSVAKLNEKKDDRTLHRDTVWSYRYFLDDELQHGYSALHGGNSCTRIDCSSDDSTAFQSLCSAAEVVLDRAVNLPSTSGLCGEWCCIR